LKLVFRSKDISNCSLPIQFHELIHDTALVASYQQHGIRLLFISHFVHSSDLAGYIYQMVESEASRKMALEKA
jgi:hypothetical protein